MTQSLAYWILGICFLALALDVMLFGSDHLLFLSKKFLDILHWMAFWR